MLEETLSSPTYSPAEAGLTLISFVEVELAAGGAAAEARFFKLFSMLCNRLFGGLSEKENYKHEIGGWLSRHVRWERPSMSMSMSSTQKHHYGIHRPAASSSSSVKTDPVVKLLGASVALKSSTKDQQHPLTLLEAFAKEAEHRPNVRYSFPFQGLPKSTQDAWISLIEAALGGTPASEFPPSENSSRLLGSLLRVKPLEQNQLRQYQQSKVQKKDHRRPLQLSPMYANTAKSPTMASTPTKEKGSHPKILLSMLEYYLLVFIRYPLAAPVPQLEPAKSTTQGVQRHSIRRSETYGESVYYQLFQEYVTYYVPVGKPQGTSNGFPSLQRPSELFIRAVIELWLEGQNQLSPTSKVVQALQDRRGSMATFDLNMSYDFVKAKYEPHSYQITRCLHKLVARAQSDGAILDMVRDVHEGFRGASPEIMCLSPSMTIMQLPFYNYVRNAFRHASIHARQSPFYAVLNDWLVWLEPWNTKHDKGKKDPAKRIMETVSRASAEQTSSATRVTYPRANQRSMYQACWEPYIASNLHLYTVPLAIFLRRARELDFSPREYKRSLNTVSRVLRVFSPEVIAVINQLLSERQSGSKYSGIVARHEKSLCAYAPPSSALTLASCQDDMQSLLEEIYLQHLKKIEELDFIDRAVASVEGFFGQGAYTGEEKKLHILFEKAKVVVGFPKEYEVMPCTKSRSSSDSQARGLNSSNMDRSKSGHVSEAGLQQWVTGETKCNPQDIGYFGDTMLARPQSHEVAVLVPILNNASKFVNTRLGIIEPADDEGFDHEDNILPRRFNFRFLADYRNIAFLTFGLWLWKLTS